MLQRTFVDRSFKQKHTGGIDNISITRVDPVLLQHPGSTSLGTDMSLERLFGPGATKLALEMEGFGGAPDIQSNKRLRGGKSLNVGNPSNMEGDEEKSEGFEDGVVIVESKKPKMGGSDNGLSSEGLNHDRDPESHQDLVDA